METLIRFCRNNLYGYRDINTGKEVISLKYDDARSFSEDLAAVKLNNKWGFIDKTGREVTPLKYDDASFFNGGLVVVKLDSEEFSIDKSGKRIN